MSDWVSVEDRLPEIGKEVIVFCPHKYSYGCNPVTSLVRYKRHEGAVQYFWDNHYPGNENTHVQDAVTHWMPLPEPPEKNERL